MTTATMRMPTYFDLDKVETIAEEEATITLDYTVPVILPDDSELEPQTADAEAANSSNIPQVLESPKAHPAWLWLAGSFGVLLGLMLLVDTYHFIAEQFSRSLFLGSLFLGIILLISGSIIVLTRRAYKNIVRLRSVSAFQKEGKEIMANNGYGGAIPYTNKIAKFYQDRPDIKTRLKKFYDILNDSHHDRDVCQLFSTQVMKEMDLQAKQIVIQRSKETALMVMISQIAILDTLLTLWRNTRMIRDISTLYGGRPGFLGSIGLISSVLQNLIYADVSEMVADSMAEIMGGSILSVMSAQAAQGLGSGVMTARVGLHAIQACRPLPFSEAEKPRLRDIRKEIVKSMKSVFETKEAKKPSV
jgi:putative membrane protein